MIPYTEREEKAFRMWADGVSYANIGKDMGITCTGVYDLLRRRDVKTMLNARLEFIRGKITVRTANTLIRNGVISREKMQEIGRDGLAGIYGIGTGTAEEIWRSVFGNDDTRS